MLKIIFLFLIIITFSGSGWTATVKEFFPKGYVDWTRGEIHITGRGRAQSDNTALVNEYQQALDEAITDYFLKAYELLSGLRIDHDTIGGVIIRNNPAIQLESERLISCAGPRAVTVAPDGRVTLKIVMRLWGADSIGALFYENNQGATIIDASLKNNWTMAEVNPDQSPANGQFFTGLIIDARHLDLKPALNPLVVSASDEVLYGNHRRPAIDFAGALGPVIYLDNLQEARTRYDRVGETPLILQAMEASGPFSCDVRLLDDDAQRLKTANAIIPFLNAARVIIVLKSKDGQT